MQAPARGRRSGGACSASELAQLSGDSARRDLEPVSETPSVIKPPTFRFVRRPGCAIYVCLPDHGAGLALALQIERQIVDPSVPILAPAVAVVAEIGPLLAGEAG